jgi:hypothetical protein
VFTIVTVVFVSSSPDSTRAPSLATPTPGTVDPWLTAAPRRGAHARQSPLSFLAGIFSVSAREWTGTRRNPSLAFVLPVVFGVSAVVIAAALFAAFPRDRPWIGSKAAAAAAAPVLADVAASGAGELGRPGKWGMVPSSDAGGRRERWPLRLMQLAWFGWGPRRNG